MKFYFHPNAKEELDGAVAYYEQCQPGLGLEFAEEVYATIAPIIQYPTVSERLVDTLKELPPLLGQ